jgi:hypothetical protein
VKTLVAQLPQEVGVLLTADHGIVDVPSENHLLLDEFELPGLLAVTGDPRNSFLYFERGSDLVKKKNNLQELSGDNFIVATFEDLVQSGWFEKETSNPQFMPDLFLISTGNFACYHRGFAKPQSLRMIGQHGSISTAELSVPLLKLGAFAG